ncbi:sulfite exporter TauE/SafE family protein [Euzebya rosea]|uniref:sulfite exporter TauE/SafE family protein n=1 Tax=Euzebya rosea TaxID=2052804 RepID=UPI0013006761|nr:TSUP family transporter [Euzebya rosea]
MPALLALVASLCSSGIGTLAGIGGAVLLVPVLVVLGLPASEAAPLGLVSVAAGSVAAGAPQLRERIVNHRLGVTTEVVATTGAAMGALAAGLVDDRLLARALAVAALAAAVAVVWSRTERDRVLAEVGRHAIGEWPGRIAGATDVDSDVVTYRARRLPVGLALMWVAGVTAGTAGVSGGFLKTPVTATLMGIPPRVAAATTTFTVGVTAAAGLVVMTLQGRVDAKASAAVVAGSLLGGRLGAAVQGSVPRTLLQRGLAAVLVVVAVLLWGSS